MMDLFRNEVLERRGGRLHGDVILTGATSNWLLIYLLLGIVGALAVWAAVGTYARTELVLGRVTPQGPMVRIVPTRPGVIAELSVRDGDVVRAGQPLATIWVEQGSADRADPSGANIQSIDSQSSLLDQQIDLSRKQQSADALKLDARLMQYRQEIASIRKQISVQENVVQSARDSFEPLTKVMENGYFSRIQFENKRQQYLSAQAYLLQLNSQLVILQGQLQEATISRETLAFQVAGKLSEFNSSKAMLLQKRIDVENSRSYVVTAPASGRITSLQVRKGSTVSSQSSLMSVVDDTAEMSAEIYAPSRAIGFARIGQEVRLMYDAFPYQRFGSFSGNITDISRAILQPSDIDPSLMIKEPVYRIRVSLERQTVTAFGEAINLQPGMTLRANLILDRRSFFEWLLSPINAVRNRT